MQILEWINDVAGYLFIAGVGGLALINWRRWQSDHRTAHRKKSTPPVEVILEATPKVSVLVAAWNEEKIIHQHIQSFMALRYPHKELILGAGGTDKTLELARQCVGEQVVVFEQPPGTGKQRTLHQAYRHASGDLLFLTDADCYLDDSVFEHVLAPLINEGEACATGTSRPLKRQLRNPFVLHLWFITLYVQANWGKYTDGILGRNVAVTRAALDAINGFEEDVRTGTDYVMAKRLHEKGYKIRYVGSSSIETTFAEDLKKYRTQQSRWIRNVLWHGVRFNAQNEVRAALISTLVGIFMLIVGPLLALIVGPIALVGWLLLWVHGLLSRVRYMRFGELVTAQPLRLGYLMLPFYMALDFFIWALVARQYFSRTRRNRW